LEFASEKPAMKPEVSLFDLINAVNAVLKRINERENLRDIFEDKWTVSEKIEHLMQIVAQQGPINFSILFASATSRSEVVVTFLALLELIRLKQLVVSQLEPFGEIEISRAPQSNGAKENQDHMASPAVPVVPDAATHHPEPASPPSN